MNAWVYDGSGSVLDTFGVQTFPFLKQGLRVKYTACRDSHPYIGIEDTGRHLVKNPSFPVHPYGVTGVRPALIAYGQIKAGRNPIYHLALALVTPLKSYKGKAFQIARRYRSVRIYGLR
jgi:hypothetical protein